MLVPLDAMLIFGKHVAGKNVRGDELVGGLRVVLVPNLFVQAADEGFVLLSGH